MRSWFIAGVILVTLFTSTLQADVPHSILDGNPEASPDAVVVAGKARFTILTPWLIRLEWSRKGDFEDRASLMAINRHFDVPHYTSALKKGWLTIETDALVLKYRPKGGAFDCDNLTIQRKLDVSDSPWTPGNEDKGNLGGTVRTLDGVSGSIPLDPGILSRDGWTLVDDSHTLLLEGDPLWPTPRPDTSSIDWYFFGYGHDYRQAMRDYTELAGGIPLPPRWSFGAWWSRYWAYSEDELKELVRQFDEHDVPLDVLVVDMDWHLDGWTGYTWNRDLFPDPKEFLDWVHKQGLHTTLNLHPHDGVRPHEAAFPAMAKAMGLDPNSIEHIPFDIADQRYMKAYFEVLHHPLEKEGVDFWWIDWQQGEASNIPGLDPLFWLNHLHWMDMENRQWETGKRPLIFSRWGGLGSHRYQIGFSGDTFNNWQSLAFQPGFTATAGNVAYPFWSHDIGGHQPGPVEGELYARWIQFAALNPYLRTHATKNPAAKRRIWEFGDEIFGVARDAFRFRYSLVPYIYSSARRVVDDATPLMQPLYYEWQEYEEAYNHPGEYLFGDQLLASPVTSPRDPASRATASTVWLPPGQWVHWFTGQRYEGPGIVHLMTPLDQIPLFAKAGAIVPTMDADRRIGTEPPGLIQFDIVPGDSGHISFYEDDGVSADYLKGSFARTEVTLLKSSTGYHVVIDSTIGHYADMPETRDYRVRLLDVPPATNVLLLDQELPRISSDDPVEGQCWWFDQATLSIVVSLPNQDVRTPIELRFTGLPDNVDLLSGVRGHLDMLREFSGRFGDLAPNEATTLLLMQERFADFTSEANDILSLAQQVQTEWGHLAAAFSAAAVEDDLRREAFLRLHGLSLSWKPTYEQGLVSAKATLTLLEPLEGIQAHFDFSAPEGWVVKTPATEKNVELILDENLSWNPLYEPSSSFTPSKLKAVATLISGDAEFTIPFETLLFPSINAWQIIGPFDNPGRHDLNKPFGPESSLDLAASYKGKQGKDLHWQLVARSPEDETALDREFVVDLQQVFGEYTEDAVAYGLTWLEAPDELDAWLELGSDDGIKVWLNGEVVHENEIGRAYTSRADRVPVHLNAGMNSLLLKVSQGNGGWAFSAHLVNEEGNEITTVMVRPMP